MNSIEQQMKDFQEILLVLRKALGLSARELGNLVGVTRQTINNFENGKKPLPKTLYLALRYVLVPRPSRMTWDLIQIIVDAPECHSPTYRRVALLKAKDLADRIYRKRIDISDADTEWRDFILSIDDLNKEE